MFIERKNWSLHVFTLFSPGSKKFLKSVTNVSESGPGTVQLKGDFRSDVDVNLQGFGGVYTDSSQFSILDTPDDSCALPT